MGDAATALNKPDAIILTESSWKKYFGDEDPMGKLINSDRRRDYIVTGVIKDFPKNSHFKADFLSPLSAYQDAGNDRWVSNNFYTYIVFREGVDPNVFEPKMYSLIEKYAIPQIERFTGQPYDKLQEQGANYEFKLQPLVDIHLHSNLEYELEPNSDASYIYIFSIVAIAILLIACINFMNLSTARSATRALEVGIRKTLGSNKAKLVQQFLIESILLTFIAVIFATIIIKILLPFFNDLAGKNLEIGYFDNPVALPAIIGFALIVGLFAGIYPAFFLTSFIPVEVLKGNTKMRGKGAWMRSTLVIFQFSVSIILFVGTFIVYNQLQYIQNKKLGFNKDQVVVLEKTDDIGDQIPVLKQQLLENNNIKSVTNHQTIPGSGFGNSVFQLEGESAEENHLLWMWFTDYDLLDTYEIEMAEGRFFSEEFPSDSNAVVINEKAMKAMGITDPLSRQFVDRGRNSEEVRYMPIIGVMKDFHFQSLHSEIRPMIIFPIRFNGRYTAVKIASENITETLAFMENKWKDIAHDQAFEYVFLDEEFMKNYEAEMRTGDLFTSFSVLAILIACLGLYGLAAFITEQRTKEIGIRKVMGASVGSILLILCREFSKWVLIATIISWPLAYFGMDTWLEDFYYRIDITWGVFILSGVVALVIAIITVSTQVIKAATANPADSLRYE